MRCLQRAFANQVVKPVCRFGREHLDGNCSPTDGQYFQSSQCARAGLVYEAVNRLEPVEQDTRTYRPERSFTSGR